MSKSIFKETVEVKKKYLRKAKIIAKVLSVVPFIRMIGLNGSLTAGTVRQKSDIDFLIISAPARIWTCRFLTTILTHLSGQRRHGNRIAGRICLNRYQTEDFLEIKPHDSYHARVFSSLVPLFDLDIYLKYQKENRWTESIFKLKVKPAFDNFKSCDNPFLKAVRKLGEFILGGRFGDSIERKLKNYQKERILKDLRTWKAPRGRVRVSDKELCFHP